MASRFRIQYINNLHLECYPKAVFPLIVKPKARYLALTGNIGVPQNKVYESFLDYVSSHWDQVFYVAGLKEYSTQTTIKESHAILAATLKKRHNIHFFHYDNTIFTTSDEVAVVGGTLMPPEQVAEVADAHLWNTVMMNQWKEHMDYRNYLIRNGGSTCIVTNDKLDAPDQFKKRPVQAWIEGTGCLEFQIIHGKETSIEPELAKSASKLDSVERSIRYWE